MTATAERASAARPHAGGRRELNKQQKVQRIQRAAHELFEAMEYDQVTTRLIARQAGVALGTLFLYADDKLDLLFLAVNDELEQTLQAAQSAVEPAASLIDNLTAAFEPFYRYYARRPHLSKTVLRQMLFVEKGRQVRRFLGLREQLIGLCARVVDFAVKHQQIARPDDCAFVGWLLFGVYQVELRRWLWTDRSAEDSGIRRLRRALELVVNGLGAVSAGNR